MVELFQKTLMIIGHVRTQIYNNNSESMTKVKD